MKREISYGYGIHLKRTSNGRSLTVSVTLIFVYLYVSCLLNVMGSTCARARDPQVPSRIGFEWKDLRWYSAVSMYRKLICKTVRRDFHTSLNHYRSLRSQCIQQWAPFECSQFTARCIIARCYRIVRDAASATRGRSHVRVLIFRLREWSIK